MDALLAELVRERATRCCEYCRLPEAFSSIPFEIDHIIARKHGGLTASGNLALSCFYCNSRKGPNIAGLDSESQALSRRYHPHDDRWDDHFRWDGPTLVGITAAGPTTIEVLGINADDSVLLRTSLIREGVFPPPGPGRASMIQVERRAVDRRKRLIATHRSFQSPRRVLFIPSWRNTDRGQRTFGMRTLPAPDRQPGQIASLAR